MGLRKNVNTPAPKPPEVHTLNLPSGETMTYTGKLDDWAQGEKLGMQLVGQSANKIGADNQALNQRIQEMADRPSMGANRLQEAGNAQLSQLIANQAQQGVTGGLADAQRLQVQRNTSRDVAGRAQSDYDSAVDRLTNKQKSDAGTFVNLTSSRAALSQAAKSNDSGMSFICTELKRRGLISQKELDTIHKVMWKNLWRNPREIAFYLEHGEKLVESLNKSLANWDLIKSNVFNKAYVLVSSGLAKESMDHYVSQVETLAYDHYFKHASLKVEWEWSIIRSSKCGLWTRIKSLYKISKLTWRLRRGE